MRARDVLKIARQRAGITQQQLAERSGHPRESVARWESGSREPSLATLQSLVEACGLELTLSLTRRDTSLADLTADQRALTAKSRLDRLMPAGARRDSLRALRWLARTRTPAVVVGDVAAALQGAPTRVEVGEVEIVSSDPPATEGELRAARAVPVDTPARWRDEDIREPWTLPRGGTLVLARQVPGTSGYADLRRNAQRIRVDDQIEVSVAHPRDLLRLAGASPREEARARIPGLTALLAAVTRSEAPA